MYLKCDVLLLSDVFGKFRNNNLKNHELCPRHYLSATGLSWNAMLTMTKIELKLIADPAMFIFFEKGTKSGISYIYNRYSKASNKYLKYSDPKEESKLDIFLDTNNLYGYAKSNFFPTSVFKSIDPKEFDLNKYTSNISEGCVLEGDLECPKELRELHYDYPLALDKLKIIREMLSEYQLKIADLYNIPIGNVKKIVPNFFDKKSMCFIIRTYNFT